MIYKAYLKQPGEGCNYTIGCGQTVITIDASDMEDALEKISKEIKEYYNTRETRLAICEIYEVNQVFECDVNKIYKVITEEERIKKQKLKDDLERKEFERLRENIIIK